MADEIVIVDTPPPAAPPAPTSEIHVTPGREGGPSPDAPKPGSARERMYADLAKRAKPSPISTETEPRPPIKSTEEPPGQGTPEPSPELEPGEEPEPAKTEPAPSPKPQPEGKKKGPWAVADEWKARATKAEADLVEARKGAIPPAEREKLEKDAEAMRKRNEELESEIRFVNYQKSKEYVDNFETPYNNAWKRAMEELSEVTVEDPQTGERRQAKVDDMMSLVNKPLGEAMQEAQDRFGALATEVMAFRKEIRKLFEAKDKALNDARTMSEERQKQNQEFVTKFQQQLTDQVNENWTKSNDELLNDEKYGKYFKPVEGDQNINQRLAKGYQLVDRAMRENPRDPNLTPEQRQAIVRRHAALRHRAAAFGRVFYELTQAHERIAQLEERLESYEETEPTTEGGSPAPSRDAGPVRARDQVHAALLRIAK